MNYRLEIIIKKPRNEVWQAFTDSERMKVWQPALTSVELISGTRGQPGAVSKLTYFENKREFSLTERITYCLEPGSLHQTFDNEFAENTVVKNSFIDQGPAQTLWITETEYKFNTTLMKLLQSVYQKNLTRRTQRDMERFRRAGLAARPGAWAAR